MSQPRYLADQDLNERILAGLIRREPAVSVVRVREIGLSKSSDADILEHASRNSLIVVSHDVTTMPAAAFERMAAGADVAGLFMAPQNEPIRAIIESLLLIWAA